MLVREIPSQTEDEHEPEQKDDLQFSHKSVKLHPLAVCKLSP